jgi:hypothetical protein
MKKLFLVAGILTMVMLAPSLGTASLIVDRITGYYAGSGGEFTLWGGIPPNLGYSSSTSNLTNTQGIGTPSFQTFCLESDEFVNIGGSYNYAFNYRAINGGVGSGGDPISVGTSWLYSQFAQGYNLSLARAGELQSAIWYLEGEGGGLSTDVTNLLLGKFGAGSTFVNWSADAVVGDNGVYVLNLTNLSGGLAQDMLYYKSEGNSVPIPPTVYLLGAGLLGLVGMRRKFRK